MLTKTTEPSAARHSCAKISPFGGPSATSTRSGRASASSRRTSSRSDAGRVMSMRGLLVPTIWRPGVSSHRRRAARSATPGPDPSRKTRQPRRPAKDMRGRMRSDPETFSGTGMPKSRDAQRTGMPSTRETSTDS